MNGLLDRIVECLSGTRDLKNSFQQLQRLLKAHTGIEGIFLGHHAPGRREVFDLVYADSAGCREMVERKAVDGELRSYLLSAGRQELNVLPELGRFPALTNALYMIPSSHGLYDLRVRLDGEHIGMLAIHTPHPAISDETARLLMRVRQLVALPLAMRLESLRVEPLAVPVSRARPGECCLQSVSPTMLAVQQKMAAVALSDMTVLLTGETGVGKDVYARHMHALSARRNGPFVHVNCGGIAESLADSELFGHEKGAFTGAQQSFAGLFEQAHTGTLFLDEIGELPLSTQARLLLVLQDRCIRRVGGFRSIPLDIRIIAATNRDLEAHCRAGHFRQDLLFRLNSISLRIPALRERPEDIPLLATHLLAAAAKEFGLVQAPAIHPADMAALVNAPWLGNVRELAGCLRRSLIFSTGPVFRVDTTPAFPPVPPTPLATPHEERALGVCGASPAEPLQAHIRRHLEDALVRCGGRIHGPGGAAEQLGINPSTLRSRLRKLGIPFGRAAEG